ncbi:hypothetical protein V3481_017220 [Fusarium oxysporum f. sp. vasinfectum]
MESAAPKLNAYWTRWSTADVRTASLVYSQLMRTVGVTEKQLWSQPSGQCKPPSPVQCPIYPRCLCELSLKFVFILKDVTEGPPIFDIAQMLILHALAATATFVDLSFDGDGYISSSIKLVED